MNLSVVIPAYNEEKYLPQTIESLKLALENINDVEIIVVDNASTDATRAIAASFGAHIGDEKEHNIGKVRNTGAAQASGDTVVFLDADTNVCPGIFEKIMAAMADSKCIGGSAAVEYDGEFRRVWVRWFMLLWPLLGKFMRMRQGALQFCRKDVFFELGGYDATIFVGEDIEFHWRLDKAARKSGCRTAFIEEPKVRTSSRRWDQMGLLQMLFFTHPVTIFLAWRFRPFWKAWYEKAIR